MAEETKPLMVQVTGGEHHERHFLASALSESIKEKGFKKVDTYAEPDDTQDKVGALGPRVPGNKKGTSIYDLIEKGCPELFERQVIVHVAKTKNLESNARVKLIAGEFNGVALTDTRGDVRQFLEEAGDLGMPDEYTVKSTDPYAIGKAVAELLIEVPRADVKAELVTEEPDGTFVMTRF